jgi:predicted ribosomally synthesized peptide with nif11-like leader
MSSFVQHLKTDAGAREKVARAKSLEEVARIAAQAGFVLSASDLELGVRALQADELSERELDAVAGGAGNLEMLATQTQVQNYSQFTQMLSNIAKADSDSKLNSIRNMRG